MGQRSRAQFRSNSGTLITIKEGEVASESKSVALVGKVMISKAGANREIWVWPLATDGVAGVGWESGEGFAAQHGIGWPAGQQAWDCFAQAGTDDCAGNNGTPRSRTLQTMTQTDFMNSLSRRLANMLTVNWPL